ncbi:MAG: hypothetical protein MJZ61_04885 [Bacteroidales bacterium]|nr:hypothetical protein [Bacteroidales bacterium]
MSDATGDVSGVRLGLGAVLQKAGIEVVYASDKTTDEEAREQLQGCDCSIHTLGALNIYSEDGAGYDSPAGQQYRLAREVHRDGFKMFVWNPSGLINSRNQYVNSIRRDIVENTIYSCTTSPIVFVEELRSIMSVRPSVKNDLSTADIFFIYNDLDRDSASDILSMLQDVQKVASLGIDMNTSTDYSDFISSQLSVCKLGVIYYDYASDWALSFARQVWKDNGGQSGPAPLFVAANSAHAKASDLEGLKDIMEYSLGEQSLIPLDIKIYFDKVTTKK